MASPDIDLDEERELDREFPNRMDRSAFEASLPRAAYVDEAFLDVERERLWWAEWVAVGPRGAAGRARRLPERRPGGGAGHRRARRGPAASRRTTTCAATVAPA